MPAVSAPFPGSVLAVRLGAIGDVVNALVFASAVKEHAPATRVGWVVHPLALPLVEGHPDVDRVHVWRRGGGARELARLVRQLRDERYEVAVDLQRLAKSASLARASGAPRVIGYDRGRAKEQSWLLTTERLTPPEGGPTHMVEQYLEFARHLGCPAPEARHRLPPDAAAEAWAAEFVRELGGEPVLLNLGASKPANRWAPERFGELAARLAAEDLGPCVLTGGPDDRAAADAALSAGARDAACDRVGATSLLQLAALARRARAMVTADTGPMHLAAAAGAPVVALFGAADPRRTGPWGGAGRGHEVLRVPPPCAPCNAQLCDQPRHACMEDLTVELVLAALRRRLRG
jgi:lipopolysaccharide heptosyltransferase II